MSPAIHPKSIARRLRAAVLGLVAISLGAGACRDATQITLHVRTNLPCTDQTQWRGVAVHVGEPGQDVESASPTLVTDSCDEQGHIGSLVVVPSSSNSAAVGIRVVAGIDAKPEDCADRDYLGCIVARRSLRFTPHSGLDLDIQLNSDCVSVGCDADHTCVGGTCESSEVDKVKQADSPSPGEPSVRCGDDGVRCATSGNVCCLKVDGDKTSGDCRPSELCEPPNIVLNCDDDSDCPATDGKGHVGLCSVSYVPSPEVSWTPMSVGLSDCAFNYMESTGTVYTLALCGDHKACMNGAVACENSRGLPTNPLPNYFWCYVDLANPQ